MKWSELKKFLLQPKCWPSLLGLFFLKLISLLPISVILRLKKPVGQLFGFVVPYRKKIAAINISHCFPEYSKQKREQLLTDNFIAVGAGILETVIAWFCSDKKIGDRLEIKGEEQLIEAKKQNQGVILLGAHFCTIDLPGRLLANQYQVSAVYRQLKNPVFNTIMINRRKQIGHRAIDRQDIKQMIQCLKQKEVLWFAPDQDYGRKHSVFAPFFGISTATITATSRLAKITNAIVLPAFQYRLPNGRFRIEIGEPVENFPSSDLVQDAARINEIIEAAVKKHPEQYLWQHKRFKTRPLNEPSFYKTQ